MNRVLPALLCAAALFAGALPVRAQLLYRAARGGHTVYLLGSVHLLPHGGQALGPAVDAAYAAADALAFELAPDALAGATPLLMQRGLLPPDSSLTALLPDSLGPRLTPYFAGPLGAVLPRARPWFAALLVEQFALAQHGYDAASGVEMQLFARAAADGRPVHAFETVDEQLAFFAAAPWDAQVRDLAAALARSDSGAALLDHLVARWRTGDAEGLAALLDAEFAGEAAQRERFLDARNRAWIAPLEAFSARVPTLLVVVGAGHLVGEAGLVALLRAQGWAVAQVPTP